MVALFKAVIPGGLLTWIVCMFFGSAGSSGGFLHVYSQHLADHSIYWSWPLFTVGTLLAWFVYANID
ncbi:hypothetical protein [Porphyrobacter sp. GA68]|uniref:hypothetical protein n=1 Tax=Porphyrobacter sp. GA68 TaxID=2883480 RepID=UPI001D18E881|nr:hypothetical protein [Porphyrobacter sp. GA68]